MSCYSESVASLSAYLDRAISVEILIDGLPLNGGEATEEQLPTLARRAGLVCVEKQVEIDKLERYDLPAILVMGEQSPLVVVGVEEEGLLLLDMETQEVNPVELSEIVGEYSGRVYTMQPDLEAIASANESNLSGQKRGYWLWPLIWRERKQYVEAASGTIAINILGLALPLFMMAVYDRIIPNFALESLAVLGTGLMLVALLDFGMRILRSVVLDNASKRIDVVLGNRVFNQILRARIKNMKSSGDIANSVKELDMLREFMNSSTLSLLADVPFLFLFLFCMYYISGNVVFVPLTVLPLVLIFFFAMQVPLYHLMQRAFLNASNRSSVLFEMLNGLETIQALGAGSWASSKWERAHAAGVLTSTRSRFYTQLNQNVLTLAGTVSMLGVIVVGVYGIKAGDMSFGALFAAVILNGRILAPLSQIAQSINRLHAALIAFKSVDALMHLPAHESSQALSDSPDLEQIGIKFSNVSFDYPISGLEDGKIEVLNNINFEVEPGEKVAILGPVGCGKSTLLKLLVNVHSPDTGAISLNGVDLRNMAIADVRAKTGYVPQDLQLYSGTLSSNILLNLRHPDEEDVKLISHIAGIDTWLGKSPLGYALPVGERGDFLSGGQKQAVVLARGLVGNPRLLIMDEPTSLLDSQSEALVVQRLKHFVADKTVILSTHRPALLELVDRIIVLNECQVLIDGPRDEVLKKLGNP